MTLDKEAKYPNPLLMGGIGVILLLISFYIFTNHFRTLYPASLEESVDFFTQYTEVSKYAISYEFSLSNIPLAAFGIFFSLSFIGHAIFDNDKFRSSTIYLIILNAIFLIPFCILPAIKVQTFSLFHFVYFFMSLIPLFFFKITYFSIPSPSYFFIYPILFIGIKLTSDGIRDQNISNPVFIKKEVADSIKASKSLPNPEPETKRWIFHSGQKQPYNKLQATLFTSIGCEDCKNTFNVVKEVAKKFGNFMTMQFIPFPHSSKCNPYFQGKEIAYDCEISKLALCLNNQNFPQIIDMLILADIEFNPDNFLALARKAGKQDCYMTSKGDNLLTDMVRLTEVYKLKKSPILLVNGIMLEPPYDVKTLTYYFGELLDRSL